MPPSIRPWYWPAKGQPERTEPFTWIVEGVIAASWWPDPSVFDIYDQQNIRAVFRAEHLVRCIAQNSLRGVLHNTLHAVVRAEFRALFHAQHPVRCFHLEEAMRCSA